QGDLQGPAASVTAAIGNVQRRSDRAALESGQRRGRPNDERAQRLGLCHRFQHRRFHAGFWKLERRSESLESRGWCFAESFQCVAWIGAGSDVSFLSSCIQEIGSSVSLVFGEREPMNQSRLYLSSSSAVSSCPGV